MLISAISFRTAVGFPEANDPAFWVRGAISTLCATGYQYGKLRLLSSRDWIPTAIIVLIILVSRAIARGRLVVVGIAAARTRGSITPLVIWVWPPAVPVMMAEWSVANEN